MLDLINIDLIVAICELLKHPFKLICMWLMAKLFEKYPDLPQQIALIRHGKQSPQTLVVNVILKPVNHCCCCSDSFDETEIIPFSGVSSLVTAIRCGWVKFSFRSFVRFSGFTMALK